MEPTDRLHALDAVRAYALLLGVVLHSAAAFLQNFPMPMWQDQPSTIAAVLYFVIHMFRMSAFFLMAGFFARLLVERRGVVAFIKDRGKRVAVPLFLFLPVVVIMISMGFVLGALLHGLDYLLTLPQTLQPAVPAGPAQQQAAAAAAVSGGGGFNFAHLWFLYYLLIFYILALASRTLIMAIDPRGVLAALCDKVLAFVMSGVWGPVLIALPLIAYLWQLESWNEWLGLPAPFNVTPNMTAIVGYGLAFGVGWMLNRQVQRLLDLQKYWYIYLGLALVLTFLCLETIGTTPRWQAVGLAGAERILYTSAYVIGLWCWIFAFVGAAVRYLSNPIPVVRYLADASYWIYLFHMATILFFLTFLRPYDWHWSIKFAIMVIGSMPILLVTYHYFVRYTWIGAILNGRRHPRPEQAPPAGAAPAQA